MMRALTMMPAWLRRKPRKAAKPPHPARREPTLEAFLDEAPQPTGKAAAPNSRDPLLAAHADIRKGLVLLIICFGGFGGWMALAPISSAVVAEGVVRVDNHRKLVQTPQPGVVSKLMVKEGQFVEAGQTLLVLHDARVDASYGSLKGAQDAELARRARLEAEQRLEPAIQFPEPLLQRGDDASIARIMLRERELFAARMANLREQIRLLGEQRAEAIDESRKLQEQMDAQKKGVAVLRDQMQAQRKLADSEFVSRSRLQDFERSERDAEARIHELEGALARVRQKIRDFDLRSVGLKSGFMQAAAQELKDNNQRLMDLEQQLQPSAEAAARQIITAPAAGQLFGLKVASVGEVVAGGVTLAEIVPANAERIVEGMIPVREVRHVKVGSKATVRLLAYNQRTTPEVDAKVMFVSADRVSDRPLDNPLGPSYQVRLRLDQASLRKAGIDELIPGMAATVYIKAGERTMLAYLLEPLTDAFSRAFRETY